MSLEASQLYHFPELIGFSQGFFFQEFYQIYMFCELLKGLG